MKFSSRMARQYFHFPGGKQELTVAVGAVVDLIAADLERSQFRGGYPIAAVTHDKAARSDETRSACGQAFGHWRDLLEARLRRAGWSRSAARQEALVIRETRKRWRPWHAGAARRSPPAIEPAGSRRGEASVYHQ
jgi:hypothetical protein